MFEDELPKMSRERRAELDRQRRRSDKVSSLMGEYLLKGWRMLGESCTVCDVRLSCKLSTTASSQSCTDLQAVVAVLEAKILFCSQQLNNCVCPEDIQQLALSIKHLTDALVAIKAYIRR
ncbi:unnamed protein product [Mesocestoides corti]|uniref:Uncharacterized protein n=1 Tax=Mesocestoides corti TaxID=53468 RepID=A0A158QT10_MESCO|nr:unnamed protein product [Mesocestoides corti]